MMLRRQLSMAAVVVIALLPVDAWAHGDTVTTFPAKGAMLDAAPPVVRLRFSEPPTSDSRFEVLDGCSADVIAQVAGQDPNVVLRLDGGEPGRWQVAYNIISATDGHQSRDRYSFTVTGTRDCADPSPSGDVTPDDGDTALPPSDDPSSVPLGPILIGGVAIVVLAVVVRALSSR